jgi:hypothetical protein
MIVVALVTAGGLVYVQGGGVPTKSVPAAKNGAAASAAAAPSPLPATCALDAPCVAAEHFAGASEADPIWRDRCRDMQFLVALVPDPVDTRVGWLFDPVVESVQRAAEANHYSLDRFSLPWDEGAAKKAACKPTVTTDGKGPADGEKPVCGERSAHEFVPGCCSSARLRTIQPR